jgi:catechol 2,3-dioxygenase-like lactoylglutathione lyase family enzyme
MTEQHGHAGRYSVVRKSTERTMAMKRLHLHIGVGNLDDAIHFYSALFGAEPVKRKPEYAKWMIEDPRINFAISTRSQETGLNHLGIQVDDDAELSAVRAQLKSADLSTFDEGETVCCYARSDKSWVVDPAGIPWEAYRTMEDVEHYHKAPAAAAAQSGCGDRTGTQCCA